jgi:hypothetical protein
MTRPRVLLPVAIIALCLSGCARVREIRACRAIVREVNGALDEVEKLASAKPLDEPRIARRYGALAKSLAPHAEGPSPLAAAVRDYVAVLQSTEAAVVAHTAATGGQGKSGEPRRELERVAKRERAAASRIETECRN